MRGLDDPPCPGGWFLLIFCGRCRGGRITNCSPTHGVVVHRKGARAGTQGQSKTNSNFPDHIELSDPFAEIRRFCEGIKSLVLSENTR